MFKNLVGHEVFSQAYMGVKQTASDAKTKRKMQKALEVSYLVARPFIIVVYTWNEFSWLFACLELHNNWKVNRVRPSISSTFQLHWLRKFLITTVVFSVLAQFLRQENR